MLLAINGIYKSFDTLEVLHDVTLDVKEGHITGLIGPNGSGKSTLFEIISGFEKADAGTVSFEGSRIDQLPPHGVSKRGLMRTFQLPEGGQRLTALENLLVSATNQNEHRLFSSLIGFSKIIHMERENLKHAKMVLEILGLQELSNEYVGNLSGGQRKLIDLGRVFMARSKLCLLDEPTAGVNPTLINVILEALKRMHSEFGTSIFVIEHNMHVIHELCDYVYVLGAGSVIADGTPTQIQRDDRVLQSYLGGTRDNHYEPSAGASNGSTRD